MGRVIKFRAKDLSGEWQFGNYVIQTAKAVDPINTGAEDIGIHFILSDSGMHIIDEKTIGQFVGTFGSNKVELYEGDIVKYGNNTKGHTVAYGTMKMQASENGLISTKIISGFFVGSVYDTSNFEITVIGTVHD